MIECNFEYTNQLIDNINSQVLKKYNIFIEVALAIMLIGAVVLFVVENFVMGAIMAGLVVLIGVCWIFTNKTIKRSNQALFGQSVAIKFNEENMQLNLAVGDRVVNESTISYSVIKNVVDNKNLLFLYIDKTRAIIIDKIGFKTSEDYKRALQLVSNNYKL